MSQGSIYIGAFSGVYVPSLLENGVASKQNIMTTNTRQFLPYIIWLVIVRYFKKYNKQLQPYQIHLLGQRHCSLMENTK